MPARKPTCVIERAKSVREHRQQRAHERAVEIAREVHEPQREDHADVGFGGVGHVGADKKLKSNGLEA